MKLSLFLIEVVREFAEDSFNFHYRSISKPSNLELINHIEIKYFVDLSKEEYSLKITKVEV